MESAGTEGVVFPLSADGRRSTSALGRAVAADALRPVDPVGALGAEQETNWRSGYLIHFRRLVEAGLASKAAELSTARAESRTYGFQGQEFQSPVGAPHYEHPKDSSIHNDQREDSRKVRAYCQVARRQARYS